MLVRLAFLLIFTGSADSLTAAPMMPSQTPANDVMPPSQTPANDMMPPSQTPANDVMPPSQTPANDMMPPSQTPANDVMPPSQTPANDMMPPSQTPANDMMPSQTPANDMMPSQTPANDVMPSQTPANDMMPSQTPANDMMPSQTPANDMMPSQTPANDVMPSQTPANDMMPSQTPANDVMPSQTPANDMMPSQTPANDVMPSQTPANDVKPSQTPANDVMPSQTPANGVMPSQTPANDVMSSQTPANDGMPPQNPANDVKPPQNPANDVKPPQTPANDVKPSQTLANDVKPSQTPANDVKPSQTPANVLDPAEGAGVPSERGCSYRDILTHLDLDSQRYKATRPVRHYATPTEVYIIVAVEAILDVVEKEGKFISRIFIKMRWKDEFISWNFSEFCGIQHVSVPGEWVWKPDVFIEERLEDENGRTPYARLYSDGRVYVKNAEMVVSTCRMNVYKFPFDTQSCNLTLASGIYRSDELELKTIYSSDFTRNRSMSVMWGEYEWEFEDFSYVLLNQTTYKHQQLVYTITVKRKAVLYIVNFLLPVLFFLCLDVASFLIPDSGGEKLSFKITVLLAVTVLQLILNDILPATSNRMPIIAMYCMGTFFLMLLSLLETVVVTFLLDKDKDHNKKEDETIEGRSCGSEKRSKSSLCFYNVPDDDDDDDHEDGEKETMHELQSAAKEDNNLKGDSHGFQVILDELRDLEKNLRVFLKSKEDGGRPAGYWTRMATRINRAFSIFYVTTVIVFLVLIFRAWSPEY